MNSAENCPKTSRYKDLGPLQDLLLKACPPGPGGNKSIPVLSRHLATSHQYVYRWIDENRVPPKFVVKLVKLSGGQVSLADFHPYVF